MPRLGIQCTWDSAHCFKSSYKFSSSVLIDQQGISTTMLPVTGKRKIDMSKKNWIAAIQDKIAYRSSYELWIVSSNSDEDNVHLGVKK